MAKLVRSLIVAGLVLAVGSTAGALSFDYGYQGPIAWDLTNRDMGTIYVDPSTGQPYADGVYGPGQANALPAGIPGLGSRGGEDSWGIFRINTIFEADVTVPGVDIIEDDNAILWDDGGHRPTELIGIFYGIQDIGFSQSAGTQTIESTGFTYEVWEQPYGSFDAAGGFLQGSAGRGATANSYNGIGTNGGVAGATLWLSGVGTEGFQGYYWGGGAATDTDFVGTYTPNQVGSTGSATMWLSVTGGSLGGPGWPNLDSDFFVNPTAGAPNADIRAIFNTKSNNINNSVGGGSPALGDWTVTSSDITTGIYVVPEPMTMLAVGLAVGGLGGYIRKRRMA